jgi:hypothetical protein
MAESLVTLLCTANLAGQLDRLPRFFAMIQQIRSAATGPVFLLDLGGSCAPSAWECAATQGRATLFVLDAMGYDGACLTHDDCRSLSLSAVDKLLDRVNMPVVGPAGGLPVEIVWTAAGMRVVCVSGGHMPYDAGSDAALLVRPDGDMGTVCLDSEARSLRIGGPPGDRLGVAGIAFTKTEPDGRMLPVEVTWRTLAIPEDVRPDATIAAAVEFVREEARWYHRQQTTPNGASGTNSST